MFAMVPIPWVLVHPRHLQWCSLCDPVKRKNSHPSLVIYFFPTPAIKLKQKKGRGTTNSKPPGLINHHDDGPFRNTDPQSDRIYDTLFSAGVHRCRAVDQATANCAIMLSQNHFA